MGDPLRPEYNAADALARELKLVKAQNLALQRQCHAVEEQRDRARMLQASAEEMSSVRALEIDRLNTRAEEFLGPKCANAECPDYDGMHPYHSTLASKAFDAGQAVMRGENEALRVQIAKMAELIGTEPA